MDPDGVAVVAGATTPLSRTGGSAGAGGATPTATDAASGQKHARDVVAPVDSAQVVREGVDALTGVRRLALRDGSVRLANVLYAPMGPRSRARLATELRMLSMPYGGRVFSLPFPAHAEHAMRGRKPTKEPLHAAMNESHDQ